jgi:hypothetical protein
MKHNTGRKNMKLFLMSFILSFFIIQTAQAGSIERHNFFTRYDPTSISFVYTDDISDTGITGDQQAVNTYTQKSIQITGVLVGEDIEIRIEGRSANQKNTAEATEVDNFAILDIINFGRLSGDDAINKVVDVTEYVDFLRVGIRNWGANGTSAIDIEGIFTNLNR